MTRTLRIFLLSLAMVLMAGVARAQEYFNVQLEVRNSADENKFFDEVKVYIFDTEAEGRKAARLWDDAKNNAKATGVFYFDPGVEYMGEWSGIREDNIKWVIVGAETGNRKGRITPEKAWIDNLAEQCSKYGVPIFMKNSLVPIVGEENMRREFPEGLSRVEASEHDLFQGVV